MAMVIATLVQIAVQTMVDASCRAGPYALLVAGLALDAMWVPAAPRVNVFGIPVTDRVILIAVYLQVRMLASFSALACLV